MRVSFSRLVKTSSRREKIKGRKLGREGVSYYVALVLRHSFELKTPEQNNTKYKF